MKLFLLEDSPQESKKTLTLGGEDFHYLCRVRRLAPGDQITAKDRKGIIYRLELLSLTQKEGIFSILSRMMNSNNREREIHLFQALPKGKKMDLVVRQAAESGIKAIIPMQSDHSLIKLNTLKERISKRERWERVVREALQQSGSPVLTQVKDPSSFSCLKEFTQTGGIGFFCHQEWRNEGLILPIIQAAPQEAPIGLVIGPEGGLSTKEVDNLENWGYHALYFGENVLRTETASLYAVAALKTVLRELY